MESYCNPVILTYHSISRGSAPLCTEPDLFATQMDWLKANGHTKVHVAAKGWGSIPAAFASLLCDDVVQVTLKNALTSYTEIAESESYQWPLSSLLPGILEHFDLPDCYGELKANKKLRQIEPWGAMGGGEKTGE